MSILSCQLHKQESFSLILIGFPERQETDCKLRVDPASSYLGFCLIHKPEYLLGMWGKASQILGMLMSVVGGFRMNANMNKIEILT